MLETLHLSGRVAVVVGGTSGIGRAIALGMAGAGATVVPTGRRENLVDEVCAEIEASGKPTLRVASDIRDRASVDRMREHVLTAFGAVDILVNSAGVLARTPLVSVSEQEWTNIMDTNVTGILRTCQSFHDALKANKRGRIVNIASLNSFVSLNGVGAYAASKGAVMALTRSLAVEWAAEGINVNAIAPGVFETDLNRKILWESDRGRELLMRTPLGRFGSVNELTGAAVLLASDAASYITGQCIVADGGFLASGVNQT